MNGYLARRIAASVPVLLLVSMAVFGFLHLAPGDPTAALLGDQATAADIQEARQRWGLDQPLPAQYLAFVGHAVRGDLGESLRFSQPVGQVIASRLPATIELALCAMLVASSIAIPIGVVAGARPHSPLDVLGTTLGLFGISMPSFWFGIMLVLLLAGGLHLLPAAGRSDYGVGGAPITGFYLLESLLRADWPTLGDAARHLVAPALTLGSALAGIQMRIARSAVLEVSHEEFVTTARAKGLQERVVLWRHVLRNALIPIVTVVGLELGTLLSGSIVTESVFSWPGMGSLLLTGIEARDYVLVTGIVLTYTVALVTINLVVDLLYVVVDPRTRG